MLRSCGLAILASSFGLELFVFVYKNKKDSPLESFFCFSDIPPLIDLFKKRNDYKKLLAEARSEQNEVLT